MADSGGLRSPLARARGLGSAQDGTAHWWAQRVTAVALVPLTIWFVASVVLLTNCTYERFTAWLGSLLPATLTILLIVATFHHAQLGLQVVIEDYVHHEGAKLAGIVLVKLAAFALGAAAVVSVLKIAFGG
jgi:succinate dehydrogenase / fumarate reductase, membrane anchor subunit